MMAINSIKMKINKYFSNIDKRIVFKNFIFLLILTILYSLMFNIPYLNNFNYSGPVFVLFFIVSVLRDFIIWYIAFLNRWVFAFFTIFTFTASGGLKYLYDYVHMGLNIGTFEIVFSTNMIEASGVINPTLIFLFAISALIGIIFTFIRFKYFQVKPYSNQLLIFFISIVMLIFGLIPDTYLRHEKKMQRIENLAAYGSDLELLPEKNV